LKISADVVYFLQEAEFQSMAERIRNFVINAFRPANRGFSRLIQRNASLASSGKSVAAFRRPLVLAPHFDDELMGAGGTLLFLSAQGAQITVCFITDGSGGFRGGLTREELVIERKRENAIVSRELGYKSICMDYEDGALQSQIDSAKESVLEVVRRVQPDVLFCPFFFDHHADHRAAALIAVSALLNGGFHNLPLLCYMVGAPNSAAVCERGN